MTIEGHEKLPICRGTASTNKSKYKINKNLYEIFAIKTQNGGSILQDRMLSLQEHIYRCAQDIW